MILQGYSHIFGWVFIYYRQSLRHKLKAQFCYFIILAAMFTCSKALPCTLIGNTVEHVNNARMTKNVFESVHMVLPHPQPFAFLFFIFRFRQISFLGLGTKDLEVNWQEFEHPSSFRNVPCKQFFFCERCQKILPMF